MNSKNEFQKRNVEFFFQFLNTKRRSVFFSSPLLLFEKKRRGEATFSFFYFPKCFFLVSTENTNFRSLVKREGFFFDSVALGAKKPLFRNFLFPTSFTLPIPFPFLFPKGDRDGQDVRCFFFLVFFVFLFFFALLLFLHLFF